MKEVTDFTNETSLSMFTVYVYINIKNVYFSPSAVHCGQMVITPALTKFKSLLRSKKLRLRLKLHYFGHLM